MSHASRSLARLAAELEGGVFTDTLHRRVAAQDASPYRCLPTALVEPRHEHDCEGLVRFAGERGLALIPRGGGTSLAGQCVGTGVVVDTARHMNRILEIDLDDRRARVEPGVTAAELNAAACREGLEFGPDPSTANRASLAGMLGNNAWGPHAPVDGTTRDQVLGLRAILADGTARSLDGGPAAGDDERRRAALAALLRQHADLLRERIPAPGSGLCSNTGYPLHALLAAGDRLNEAVLFAGAEGTLGLVTELTVRLRPLRHQRQLLCPHFDDLRSALRAVRPALDAGACAVELLDDRVLELTRRHPSQHGNRFWLEGTPRAVLIIEFADGVEPGGLAARLREAGARAVASVSGADVERVWSLRRAGLGLLMGVRGPRKPVTGFEDTAVPVDRLPGYIDAVAAMLAAEGVECVHYGSVALGLVHLRPLLDLGAGEDRARYLRLLDGLAALVVAHGGVWSTKHGLGRLRAPWLERVIGPELVDAMRSVKSLYDPEHRFNPGKIVDAPDPLTDLRATAAAGGEPPATGFDWSDDRGLAAAAGRCQGAGACRKPASDGGMCPSYQATREEMHSTRGRANLLQLALAAPDPAAELAGPELHEALSLCLSCKACQHECPASVDMARLKAEHLYHYGRRHGFGLGSRAIGAFATLSALAARMPRLANALAARRSVQRLAGLAEAPPALARAPLGRWLATRTPAPAGERGAVALALDPHTMYYEPGIGRAAIGVIERLGFRVHATGCVAAGRSALSQGRLERARRELRHWLRAVETVAPPEVPVIGLEPSELLTLRDEAPRLVGAAWEARALAVGRRTVLFEEWLADQREALAAAWHDTDERAAGRIALHVHCHGKAQGVADASLRALAALPGAEVHPLAAGCCGMAGAFGYRRETAAVSRAVAELALAPAVRALADDTAIVANGTSCRQQIARTTGRRAEHPAELVARVLGIDPEGT